MSTCNHCSRHVVPNHWALSYYELRYILISYINAVLIQIDTFHDCNSSQQKNVALRCSKIINKVWQNLHCQIAFFASYLLHGVGKWFVNSIFSIQKEAVYIIQSSKYLPHLCSFIQIQCRKWNLYILLFYASMWLRFSAYKWLKRKPQWIFLIFYFFITSAVTLKRSGSVKWTTIKCQQGA